MIKTKEDLKGTFISTQDKELEKKYLTLCEELGVKWHSGRNALEGIGKYTFIGMSSLFGEGMTICANPRGNRQLTLEDFEDNGAYQEEGLENTESQYRYEKVDMTPAEIFRAMLDGEEFYVQGDKMYWEGTAFYRSDSRITFIEEDHEVCRKVEIKWQDEVQKYLEEGGASGEDSDELHYINFNFSACEYSWELTEKDFLEMCRVALLATGELE